ncbi:hypothetical protein J6590_069333 [Homalodisca vitripennis]|nr:hypothetical protein J6590_069333 [Homalodisca vitripennis]
MSECLQGAQLANSTQLVYFRDFTLLLISVYIDTGHYATNCVECQRLQARWEAVGAKLKTRLNTARVNRQTTGRVTSRRFGVVETPVFILFRQGKMYRYNIPKYDVTSFVTFATDWYKNARTENVPVPKTPLASYDNMAQTVLFPVMKVCDCENQYGKDNQLSDNGKYCEEQITSATKN